MIFDFEISRAYLVFDKLQSLFSGIFSICLDVLLNIFSQKNDLTMNS